MITVQNIPLQQKEISLLATYQFLYRNDAFVEVLNSIKDSTFKGNLTVKKGIETFISNNNLDKDPLFIEKGILSSTMKDMILLNVFDYNDVFYVKDYSVIAKMTDAKYEGNPAFHLAKNILKYVRYNLETGIDFSIIQLHDMGFYKEIGSVYAEFVKFGRKIKILATDCVIEDEKNPIINEIRQYANILIAKSLPKYLHLRGEELVAVEYHPDLLNYFDQLLTNNHHYSSHIGHVIFNDEMIHFESSELLEKLITNFVIKRMEKQILPVQEMNNLIELVLSLPEVKTERQLFTTNIISSIKRHIMMNSVAKRNYYFAVDILEKKSLFQQSTNHLVTRQMHLSDALTEILGISSKTQKIYIVSQYLLMNYFSNHEQALSDRKNMVIHTLIKLSKKYNFKLIFLGKSDRETDNLVVQKLDFTNIHGRYAIVINDNHRIIKLDAELDHFTIYDNDEVIFKDLSYLLLRKKDDLPLPIIKKIGDLNEFR